MEPWESELIHALTDREGLNVEHRSEPNQKS